MSNVMTMDNDRWEDFLERLAVQVEEPGYDCDATTEKRAARRVLTGMGLTSNEIAASFEYFEQHGGYCDCEIFMNIDMPLSWFDEDDES